METSHISVYRSVPGYMHEIFPSVSVHIWSLKDFD
jgi:hypothetical protein